MSRDALGEDPHMSVGLLSTGQVELNVHQGGSTHRMTMNEGMALWLIDQLTRTLGREALTRSRGRCALGLPEALGEMAEKYPATFRAHGLSALHRVGEEKP